MSNDRTLPTAGGLSEEEFIKAAQENVGFTKDESVIPFTKILQAQSPEIGSVPGAVPGSFLNVATGRVIDGKEGMTVIPVMIVWSYTEWTDTKGNGGQFVKDWGEDEAGWKALCEEPDKHSYMPVTREGHSILRARHFYIFQIDGDDVETSIISLSATGLKLAKSWSAMMQYAPKISTRNGMMTPAYFYYTYRVTLEEVRNPKGRWFQPKFVYNMVDNRIVSVLDLPFGKAIWDRAAAFRDQFKLGAYRAEQEAEDIDEPSI